MKGLARYSWSLLGLMVLLFTSASVHAQQTDSLRAGNVSYVSSRNVYVKFQNTRDISIGDTLFVLDGVERVPALVVTNKSSTSCVGTPLPGMDLKVSSVLHSRVKIEAAQVQDRDKPEDGPVYKTPEATVETAKKKPSSLRRDRDWKGRLSLASYSNLSNSERKDAYRFQYTFSLNGDHIAGSNWSMESYLSFRHEAGEWERVRTDLNQALKIYALAVKYQFAKGPLISLGRKINPKMASTGAIDGLQVEQRLGRFELGAIVGSRPDYKDYGVNMNFFETGGYVAHQFNQGNDLNLQHTLAVVEQKNHGKTDRRYLYAQHSSNLFGRLSLFGSAEMDVYQFVQNESKNSFRLTNFYVSARYKFTKRLNLSATYDERSNVIYYETYKNDIDRLLDEETRQGFRLQMNIQPMRYMSFTLGGNLRTQKGGGNESRNYNAYWSYNRVPGLKMAISLSANYLETSYLRSGVYGVQLSKDLFKGKLFTEAYFRKVQYQYLAYEYSFGQEIAGLSLNLRMNKNLSLAIYGEETFEKQNQNLRLNARVMVR
ncbi:MAG TPA: hypothetical protein VFX48_03975, partial [Saprospiraceae bacterium]|nr:hypothetical protein [Saprospiraceae bacterium]